VETNVLVKMFTKTERLSRMRGLLV